MTAIAVEWPTENGSKDSETMRGFLMLVVVPLLCCGRANAEGKFWRSYVEMETRAGDQWVGQGNLFLPLAQTEVSMVFADLRGNWTDLDSQNGNFGLGFRQMLVNDWIFGINTFYDMRHSQYDNNFDQASLGLELLNVDWGIRWNGYLASDSEESLATQNPVRLEEISPGINRLVMQQATERAYSGQDFEVERRMWYREAPSDNHWHDWSTFNDLELWASIGVYKFDAGAAGFEDIVGPRTRLELRVYDIAWAGPDSRLVLAGQFENDDVRGMVSQASVNVRIPFGRGVSRPRTRLRCLNRRMVAPIERNTDIISARGFGVEEEVNFAKNGRPIGNILQIDGGTVGPEGVINGAGVNSLVLVDGAAGPIGLAGPATLVDGQTILGGGSELLVTGQMTGTTAVFTAPGERPTFQSAGTVFNNAAAATESCLIGLDIATTGAGVFGVDLNGATNMLIQDATITTIGIGSHGVNAADSTFQLTQSNITTSGNDANGVNVAGASLAQVSETSIATSGDNAHGLLVQDTSFVTVQGSQIFTSGDVGSEGIFATDSAQLAVVGSTVTATGTATPGIWINPAATGGELNFSLANTAVNATGDGVLLGGNGFTNGTLNATLLGNTILTPIGVDEINATTNGAGATANLSIEGSAVDSLSGTIRLDEIAGEINVTQSAADLPASNGLPSTNVLVPSGPVTFEEPAPALPTP